MERVETDLNKSKQAREKQSREFSKQIDEERNQHERKVFFLYQYFGLYPKIILKSMQNKTYLVDFDMWTRGIRIYIKFFLFIYKDCWAENGSWAWEGSNAERLPQSKGDCHLWAWERNGLHEGNSPKWVVWAQVSSAGETRQGHQGETRNICNKIFDFAIYWIKVLL